MKILKATIEAPLYDLDYLANVLLEELQRIKDREWQDDGGAMARRCNVLRTAIWKLDETTGRSRLPI